MTTADPTTTRPAAMDESSGTTRTHLGARPGGRSERVRAAIVEATTAELLAVGYAHLTLSTVAERAGVALSTVRRRWETKAALCAATIVEMTGDAVPVPDCGTLEEDLRSMAQSVFEYSSDPAIVTLIRTTLALPESELTEIRTQHWIRRAAVAREVTQRAIARGEIRPQRNSGRVVELLVASIWMRALLTGTPLSEAELEAFVQDALVAARSAGPGSLA